MSPRRIIVALAVAALAVLALAATALAGVEPDAHEAELLPGESTTVTKTVKVPEFPPKLDLVLDVDLSSSYTDDIDTIQTKKSDIFDGVRNEVADSRFGLISFVDYPFSPWGFDDDYPYRLDQDLTTDKATWESAVDAMSTKFGGDGPESQLESLRQAATGVGQDLNGDGDFGDRGEIAPGLDPSFRADATKVIAITTDASMHTDGDSDCTSPSPCPFPYPGPSFSNTVAALNDANIKIVAIRAPGSTTQMDDLANATGGAVTSTDASSSEIVEAIVGSLEELTFDVTGNAVGCDPLDVSFDPTEHTDVAGDDTVTFQETIAVPEGTEGGEYTCTVEFRTDDGTVIGTQEVTITVPVEVPVDIKPASCPNPLSQHSRGVLPVAIVGTDGFDATRVDPDSVTLEGVEPLRSAVQDVATPFEPFTGKEERDDCTTDGGDGIADLTLKFDTAAVRSAITPVARGEVYVLTLRGTLDDGTEIIGEDVVWIR